MVESPIRRSVFLQSFLFALGYGLLFYLLQFFFAKTGVFHNYPTSDNIRLWDVGFYESIRNNGYNAHTDNTGFFFLFPYIWKLTQLGIWGIIGFNILLFSLGFGILMKEIDTEDRQFWIFCLTLPPVYFAFIPYTEALFFLLGSVLLHAISRQRLWLIWLSLILISLVRATAFFLLPALFITELTLTPVRNIGKSVLGYLVKYAIPILIGLGIFIVWQYKETGIWFAYFKKQSSGWGHIFSWPEIPFSNIENADWRYHWLSALAMFIDFVAFIFLIRQFIRWLQKKGTITDNGLLLSFGYLAMVMISTLFLNPKYGGHNTNVMGVNRYTFITPFCFYVLYYFYKQPYTLTKTAGIFLGIAVFVSLFRAYNSLNHFIIIGLVPVTLVLAFCLSRSDRKYYWLLMAIIAFNFMVQLNLFQQFIGNLYMD